MRGLIDGLENPHPLLGALPALYHEDDFVRRLVAVFDDALAPIISTLDNLDAYTDPTLAPRDFVEWLAAWVGFPIGETWPDDRSRELVARAVELYRWSGTVRGLKGLLSTYAGVEPEVTDTGGVSWSTTPRSAAGERDERPKAKGKTTKASGRAGGKADAGSTDDGPHVTVRVRAGGTRVDRRQLEALIGAAKPAHVTYTLDVR